MSTFWAADEIVFENTTNVRITFEVTNVSNFCEVGKQSFSFSVCSFFFNFFNLLLIPFLGQESIWNNFPSFLKNSSFLKSLSANENGVDLHHEEGLVNNCQMMLFLSFNQESTVNILWHSFNFSYSRVGGTLCLIV